MAKFFGPLEAAEEEMRLRDAWNEEAYWAEVDAAWKFWAAEQRAQAEAEFDLEAAWEAYWAEQRAQMEAEWDPEAEEAADFWEDDDPEEERIFESS